MLLTNAKNENSEDQARRSNISMRTCPSSTPIRLRKIGCSSPFTAACTPRCRRAPSTTCSRNTLQPYTDATPPSPRTCTPTCSGTASPRLCTAPARRFRTSRTSSDMRIRARPWSTRMPTAAR